MPGRMDYRTRLTPADVVPAGTGPGQKPYVQGHVDATSLGVIEPDGTVRTGMFNNQGSISLIPGTTNTSDLNAAARVCHLPRNKVHP
jgi:hypothetical protein